MTMHSTRPVVGIVGFQRTAWETAELPKVAWGRDQKVFAIDTQRQFTCALTKFLKYPEVITCSINVSAI